MVCLLDPSGFEIGRNFCAVPTAFDSKLISGAIRPRRLSCGRSLKIRKASSDPSEVTEILRRFWHLELELPAQLDLGR